MPRTVILANVFEQGFSPRTLDVPALVSWEAPSPSLFSYRGGNSRDFVCPQMSMEPVRDSYDRCTVAGHKRSPIDLELQIRLELSRVNIN